MVIYRYIFIYDWDVAGTTKIIIPLDTSTNAEVEEDLYVW